MFELWLCWVKFCGHCSVDLCALTMIYLAYPSSKKTLWTENCGQWLVGWLHSSDCLTAFRLFLSKNCCFAIFMSAFIQFQVKPEMYSSSEIWSSSIQPGPLNTATARLITQYHLLLWWWLFHYKTFIICLLGFMQSSFYLSNQIQRKPQMQTHFILLQNGGGVCGCVLVRIRCALLRFLENAFSYFSPSSQRREFP